MAQSNDNEKRSPRFDRTERRIHVNPAYHTSLSTAVAVSMQVLVSHPLDTLKVRLQTTTNHSDVGALRLFANFCRSEGPGFMFRGLSFPLMTVSVGTIGGIATYTRTLSHLKPGSDVKKLDQFSYLDNFVAGWVYGCTRAVVITPVELVKSRLQVQRNGGPQLYSGPVDCMRKVGRALGLRGLYQGFISMLAREAISGAIFFPVGRYVTRQLKDHTRVPEIWATMIAGGIAGVASSSVVYPLDTVKNCIQVVKDDAPTQHRQMIYWFQKLYREGGMRGLCPAFAPAMLRIFMGCGTFYSAFFFLLKYLADHEEVVQGSEEVRPWANIEAQKSPRLSVGEAAQRLVQSSEEAALQ
uniref:Mitochondrial carrier protein n=1 Tax=Fibrocapsa japonica TaxID=94617 RepID=A0A7S2V4E5_9STRA|mmetsp:Transcript_6836/g.10317  ORF Transcript_6836/g.10317 Transcript_6836/m.10317 type:complete len:354 (+) Transcript_6836:93-1154(+)|eukprot:CAMPEP_0113944594 /NCGR_PEP_ID=MMETSP1339-20121228/34758_1 /TAXON_ID=94617 /ORGANISM="Fibrocapsa japonica" /LENGTH=353 /DNA_ID=CAMNT_0000949849 /DNA_START=92 /DNA_END=1153 /DNA_ORIENTATION=- /assembly_acc=CAM_ASM_000762